MTSTYTTNKRLEKPGNGDYTDTWNVPLNGDMDVVDQAFGGLTSLNATGGSATLSASQYRSLVLSVSGAMSADVIYTIPLSIGGQWIVQNLTTDAAGGPWSVVINSGGGGTSVTVARNTSTLIYSDGTNIIAVNAAAVPGSVGTSQLTDGAVTYPKINSAVIATAADFRANTANKLLETSGTWSSANFVALTDGASIAVDFSTGFNFSVTLGGNRALANPTNVKVGQGGMILVYQDGTGSRTLTFGSNYKFANGTAPTISTAANSLTALSYMCVASNFIIVTALTGVA